MRFAKFSNRPLRGQFCGILHQSTGEARRCDELHGAQGIIMPAEEPGR